MVGIFAMVDASSLEKYKSKLDNVSQTVESQKEVILFFSFDVVNSSLYKTINYYGWAQTLTGLFRKLYGRVKEVIYEAELWRVLGDEAIFIVRIKSENAIYEYIDAIFDVLIKTIKDLKSGTFFDGIELFNDREVELMKIQNILSLKGTAWIAAVSKLGDNEDKRENIFEEYDLEKRNRFYEFLGNDIDAGFRISKYTADSRLAISFELAALLSIKTKYLQNLSIITYKHLKGIWEEKYYPIIWYHNKEKFDNLSLEDTFDYDAEDTNELIKEYFLNQNQETAVEGIRDLKMFTDAQKAISKVLHDRNLESKVEGIIHIIRNTDSRKIDYLKSPTLELHCVAVCYNRRNRKIFIAKRNSQRETEAGKWEFGCAKASMEMDICESIISEYKEDFNLDLEVLKDTTRTEQSPVPLATYQIQKDNGLHKGVIFLAFVDVEEEAYKFEPNKKHSEIKWISKSEIADFDEEGVCDFKKTLEGAFRKVNE